MKSKRNTIIAASAMVFVLALAALVVLLPGHDDSKTAEDTAQSDSSSGPDYQTVLPKGKTISQLGGWQRISPPGKDPVFAYADRIDGIAVSVSQQPLPASFAQDISGQTAELAKKFNATASLDAGDTKAYIGTSAKGPQSVIFTKNNLLVLVKSQQKIGDEAWISYIRSLIGTDPTLSHY